MIKTPMVRGLIALAAALGLMTPALAAPGPTPAEDMIGRTQPHATSYEDTLLDLAREHGLGYVEIVNIEEEPAKVKGIPGIGGIGSDRFSEQSDRCAVLPRDQPMINADTPMIERITRIDLERFLIPD